MTATPIHKWSGIAELFLHRFELIITQLQSYNTRPAYIASTKHDISLHMISTYSCQKVWSDIPFRRPCNNVGEFTSATSLPLPNM